MMMMAETRSKQIHRFGLHLIALAAILTASIGRTKAADVKDIFNLNPDGSPRLARDSKYFLSRSDNQRDVPNNRLLKPEESPEARESQANTAIEKRCSRCDTYTDYRGGGGSGSGGSGGAGGGSSYYRSDYQRYQDPRYDSRRYYDDRYDNYDRYDSYDPYYYDTYDRDRDRYRKPSYNRDDYDRYEPRDRYNNRDRNYDRQYDRGVGYDNIGYDYRGYDSGRAGYRPYDETYRGSSGWDSSGRGYYFNRGAAPETAGKWGTYASSWGYGRGDDRDRGYRDYGSSRGQGQYRPRDSFNYGTSYLYGRPSSSSTTSNPSNSQDSDNSVTDSPNASPSSDPIFFNIMSLPLKIIDKKSF